MLKSDIAGKWSLLFMHRMGTVLCRQLQYEIIHAASLITSSYSVSAVAQFGASLE